MNPHLVNMFGYFGAAAILFTIAIVARCVERDS